MSGLIALLSDYSSRLMILPIITAIVIAITVLLHFLTQGKFIKYIPSLVIGFIALGIGIYAIFNFTGSSGLSFAWIGVFLGTSALVGLVTGFLIDLFVSIKNDYKEIEDSNDNGSKSSKSKKAEPSKNKQINKKQRLATKNYRK